MLVPDENVTWNATAIPAAVRVVRAEGIDVVVTTSPPNSVHLIGAAVKRLTGVKWVADVRDSMVRNADRPVETLAARAKERTQETVGRLIARYADESIAVSDFIAEELRSLGARGEVSVISNGADFDDFAGLEYQPNGRFRVTHAGAMFGKRDPRPFLTAFARADLPDSVARFVGDFREADREWAESLGLGDRLELLPYVPRRRSLELQRDSEVNLLLMPEVPGRGSGVIAAKVFEYLAAERPIIAAVPPDGATAAFVRDAGRGRDRGARRRGRDRGGAPRPACALAGGLARRHDALGRAPHQARPPHARRGARAPAQGHLVVTRFLFLATVFSVTFEKVHWSVGGR